MDTEREDREAELGMSKSVSCGSKQLRNAIEEVWFRKYSRGFLSPQLMAQARATVSCLSDAVRGELREIQLVIENDSDPGPSQSENRITSGEENLVPSHDPVSHADLACTLAVITSAEYFVDELLQLPRELRERDLRMAAETVGLPVEEFRKAVLRWRSVRRTFVPDGTGRVS